MNTRVAAGILAQVAVSVLLVHAWAPAQVRPGERAQGAAGEPGGTAAIRGRVVAASDGRVIRGAQVELYCIEPEPRLQKRSVSDAEGRFAFTSLPAGRCLVSASRIAYLDTDYGEDRAAGHGREEIALADGQVVEDAVIRMARGGVITGQVINPDGEPAAEVTVQLMAENEAGGQVRMTAVRAPGGRAMTRTNDLGRYRLFGLPPGDYHVAVMPASGGARSSSAPVYYPGVDDVSLARAVKAEPDREVGNIDIILPR